MRTSTPSFARRSWVEFGNARRQCGQDAVPGLDQHDAQVALRVDPVEPVGDDGAGGVVQFRGELGAGRAGADDCDVELSRTDGRVLGLRAQAGVDQAVVESAGLLRGLERHGVFRRARGSEIIGDAADGDHQRVVSNGRFRADFASLVVLRGGEVDGFRDPVEAGHFPVAVPEMAPVSLRDVIQFVLGATQAACGYGMQQRFPDVGAAAIDQRDPRALTPAEPLAELGRQLQSGGAAADNDNVMEGVVMEGVVHHPAALRRGGNRDIFRTSNLRFNLSSASLQFSPCWRRYGSGRRRCDRGNRAAACSAFGRRERMGH